MNIWRLSFFSVLLALLSCGPHRVEKLTDRANAYNRSLRWSSLSAASTLISEDVRRSIVERLAKDLANIRIVDYAIVDLGMDGKKKQGSVLVEFSYYTVAHQAVRYRQELQIWNYDEAKHNWFLQDARTLQDTQ